MFEKIEKSLFDRVGTGVFLSLFISFMFTVIFQSYVSDYKLSFFGFTIALMLVSVGMFITIKLKDALEADEKASLSEKIVNTILDSKLVVVVILFMLLIKLFIL